MKYINTVVKKPWGYEYLAYENENVGLWFLHISKNQSTSLHCHPQKTTGLILLDGEAEVSFISDKRTIKSLDKVMIRRGLFHSTKALSDNGVSIFEIETPKDKEDLVRLNDMYGREHKPYEDSSFEKEKTKECLWIEEPEVNQTKFYQFASCDILVEKTNTSDTIKNKNDDDLIVFLRGGLVRKMESKTHCVTIPGDVGFAKVIKKVLESLDGVANETTIMTIRKTRNGQ